MRRFDVAIVGGGPAGATCARLLTQWGMSAVILDKEKFPREKPCAGWITPEVFRALELDPARYAEKHLLQEIRGFRTGVMYGSEIETCYPQTVSYGIRRSQFDAFLLTRSGAATELGETVKLIRREGDAWVINDRIRARMLVGAGGHSCPVARLLGARIGREPIIEAMVTEFELSGDELAGLKLDPGVPVLSFTGDMNGYGWLMRKGSYLNLGLGSSTRGELSHRTAKFCSYLKKRYGIDSGGKERFRGHAYLPYLKSGGRQLMADGVLLIGDAAGVSFAESGEGILPAIESARVAAHAIRKAGGDYHRDRLALYPQAVDRLFRHRGCDPHGIRFPESLRRIGGGLVLSNRWLTRHLVLDRWFLHR